MFLVEAIADFDPIELGYQKPETNQEKEEEEMEKACKSLNKEEKSSEKEETGNLQEKQDGKRPRSPEHQAEIAQPTEQSINYISFIKGDKIVTRMTYDNGWWFGNLLKQPNRQGFFPSNYVKVGTEAPLPEAPPEPSDQPDWMEEELKKMAGPVKSEYYQGITGYKMVKIDEKNKNILKGNYVKYDAASGLAKVPIKSQDPAAKAVRQMGYYFDYHQWCEERNQNPQPKSRPDPTKKKKKRLNLILFGEDKIKRKKQDDH